MKKIIVILFILTILLVSCTKEVVDLNQVSEEISSLDQDIGSIKGIEEDIDLMDFEDLDENLDLEGL